ncbi:MAG TPA: two-component regulator propeller domain-containing protein [Candidatus Bathyarchaeia archaeon]|nr:two-component regulator propeller domain-containing protein [Candidatus Bathyarchaeia archaeon]
MQPTLALVAVFAALTAQLEFKLDNVVPALRDEDDPRSARGADTQLPIVVEPFDVHVRAFPPSKVNFPAPAPVMIDGVRWIGSEAGLFSEAGGGARVRHEAYGIDGPLTSHITALAADSKGTLWVGTPLGLSLRSRDGKWTHIRGRDGLPVEHVTVLAIDSRDWVWIGTTRGAIQYRPDAGGRKWFYRAGPRYLVNDRVLQIDIEPGGRRTWFRTEGGVHTPIDEVTTTLLEKAQSIEKRVNERHRRFGLVAACVLDDAVAPTACAIPDNDNDGLWTAYHVAAMALCYGATGDPAAKASARESMHALYLLQNVSGTPGLVARSVVTVEEGLKKDKQWRPAPDGKFYWKSDTSSDEIDGHYLAFYTYWEHVARHDDAERDLCIKQVRALTDYIVDNNYQLIDWTGKRTRWGFWNPENLNDNPVHYIENGLNSLEILSFLDTAWYITGDAKYRRHFEHLVTEHGYLNNVLLEKKVFPDQNNHSDDQLGYVAWYPILQIEKDPNALQTLKRAVRRHYKIVKPEKPSFYAFVTATVDPHYVDLNAAVENLKEIPEDRRDWRMDNSRRDDLVFNPSVDRFGKQQLMTVPPADERDFDKWNRNPYLPAEGGDGRVEDDGAAYLLPYWMGRFHGFIAEK